MFPLLIQPIRYQWHHLPDGFICPGGGGELLSPCSAFMGFFFFFLGGVGEAAIMNNVQIVPGAGSVLLRQVFLRLNAQSPQNHETQIASQLSLMNIVLISLTCRYATTHKSRFGDLMSNHKLGWQTSDQQNKTVSCEGFFFKFIIVVPGWGVQAAFLNKLIL